MPSFEEILFCLKRELYENLLQHTQGRVLEAASPELISELGELLLSLGCKIAVIKLGNRGLYMRCGGLEQMETMGRAAPTDPSAWAGCEVRVSCFQVDVVGTTGSGDATIAGFLSALLRGFGPIEAANAAVGVGACNVEAPDALSGLRSWEDTLARIQAGWVHAPLEINVPGWKRVTDGIWRKMG